MPRNAGPGAWTFGTSGHANFHLDDFDYEYCLGIFAPSHALKPLVLLAFLGLGAFACRGGASLPIRLRQSPRSVISDGS